MKLTRTDEHRAFELTKPALQGLLADHQCCGRFPDMSCPQSTSEWAVRFGIETALRFKTRIAQARRRKIEFPKHIKAYR